MRLFYYYNLELAYRVFYTSSGMLQVLIISFWNKDLIVEWLQIIAGISGYKLIFVYHSPFEIDNIFVKFCCINIVLLVGLFLLLNIFLINISGVYKSIIIYYLFKIVGEFLLFLLLISYLFRFIYIYIWNDFLEDYYLLNIYSNVFLELGWYNYMKQALNIYIVLCCFMTFRFFWLTLGIIYKWPIKIFFEKYRKKKWWLLVFVIMCYNIYEENIVLVIVILLCIIVNIIFECKEIVYKKYNIRLVEW
jgi:hypothetical protein